MRHVGWEVAFFLLGCKKLYPTINKQAPDFCHVHLLVVREPSTTTRPSTALQKRVSQGVRISERFLAPQPRHPTSGQQACLKTPGGKLLSCQQACLLPAGRVRREGWVVCHIWDLMCLLSKCCRKSSDTQTHTNLKEHRWCSTDCR